MVEQGPVVFLDANMGPCPGKGGEGVVQTVQSTDLGSWMKIMHFNYIYIVYHVIKSISNSF
jgi:hypothetical protein